MERQALLDLLDPQDQQVQVAPEVKLVQEENLDHQELLELMEPRVQLAQRDPQGHLDPQGPLVKEALLVLLEIEEKLGPLDLQVHLDLVERVDHLVHPDQMVREAMLVHLGPVAPRDHQDLVGLLVKEGLLEKLDLLDLVENLAHLVKTIILLKTSYY